MRTSTISALLSLLSLSSLTSASPITVTVPELPDEFLCRNPTTLEKCVTKVFHGDTRRIVSATSPFYTDARLGEKVQYNQLPALIAYATSAGDVAPLIKCAQDSGFKAVPRSGGHHFEAYSALQDQLVIDVSHINYVKVSKNKETAVVGAGIRLGALYTELWKFGKSIVGGLCPTVGLGGLVHAGGFGMQMRELGFTVDYVLSAQVVLASGATVTVSKTQNEDLYWAIRGGGGGTFGIVVEFTLQLVTMPRSAMVQINWPNATDRFAASKRFLEWAPRAPKEFTSQINVYGPSAQILGWYYGKSKAEAVELIAASGLLEIGNPEVVIAGNCSTFNSRLFGYTVHDCVPDNELDVSIINVVQEPFGKWKDFPQYTLNETPKNPAIATAHPWSRYLRIAKTFLLTKSRVEMLTDGIIQGIMDRIAALPTEAQAWGEWHAWNVSSPAKAEAAFPWRDEAYAVLEFQVHGNEDPVKDAVLKNWFTELEGFLRPVLGGASYGGYMDEGLTGNKLQAYYAGSLCRLVEVKMRYDPTGFFENPMSVPGSAVAAGVQC